MAGDKAKMSHISGIRLNKPKPNFYRSKPAKENDHGKGASSMTKEYVTNGSNNIKSRVNFFEALKSLDEDGNVGHIAKSFISSCGGDKDLEEDEVYDYDGYETQFGDQFISVSPLYKEFNALNKLESQRFLILKKKPMKPICKTVRKSVIMNVYSKIDKISNDLHEMVELVTQLVRIVDSVSPLANAATKGEKDSESSEYSLVPPSKVDDKGKGISQNSNDDILKQVMTYMEEGRSTPNLPNLHHFRAAGDGPMTLEEAKLQIQEVKRLADLKGEKENLEKKLRKALTLEQLKAQEEELVAIEAKHVRMMDEYNHCINFRDDPLPITKFSYRVNNVSKEATMRITSNNQPLNLKI
ncbi:hypothetical protein Tco_1530585 [Tanacetum coccineum]